MAQRPLTRGRCLLRDYEGRIAPVQVDLVDPDLLRALDTTPRSESNGHRASSALA